MSRQLIATDNFNRTGFALGSNWVTLNNSLGGDMELIATARVTASVTGTNRAAARWVGAGSFTDDQYSGIKITALGFNDINIAIGVICRASADTDAARDFYEVLVVADTAGPNYTTQVNKVVNGTRTALDSTSRAWAVNDRVELECEGTTIRGMKNGVAFFTTTDASITTGLPGIAGANNATDGNATGDDWEGGNLISAPVDTVVESLAFRYAG